MTTLTWHIADSAGPGVDVGPAFHLDRTYRASVLWLRVVNPVETTLVIDINDDGTSIMDSTKALLVKGVSVNHTRRFDLPILFEGSWITMDIDSGRAQGLTVQLDLDR